MSVRGFRDELRRVVPVWLQDRAGFRTGFQFLYVTVGMFDRAVQALIEGTRAAWPGSDSRTDSLSAIGESRMRLQGETETVAHYTSVTLNNWLTDLRDLGGEEGLAKELNRWIAGNPMVRVITRARPVSPLNPSGGARYTTCAANGTITQVYAPWNWDGTSNPERQAMKPGDAGFFDLWIVVYAPTASLYVSTSGHWGDGQLGDAGRGLGLNATVNETDTIRSLITTWCGAHVTARCLIWSYDTAAFDPATPTRSGNPNGRWGRWVDQSTCMASRNRTHRYTSLGPERP